MKSLRVLIGILVIAVPVMAQTMKPAPSSPGAASFEKLKSLAGEWEGTMNEGGKQLPSNTSFRVVSDGSALMNVLASGTPYEMVTMFHMDNGDVLATHYCAGHNQPRFRLIPTSDPNVLNFDFKDATNLPTPDAPHMVGLKVTFVDANHHIEDWTYLQDGKKSTSRFEFHRKA
jgi:hypothetical protein